MKVDDIRCFLLEHLGKTYMRDTTAQECLFHEFLGLLSNHPTWSLRLDDIMGVRVITSRLNDAVTLQLKTNKIWFTTSWRECRTRVRRQAKPDRKRTTEQKRLTSAMRYAVRLQIDGWAQANTGSAQCARCKALLNLQVDHIHPPFTHIEQGYLAKQYNDQVPLPIKFDMARSCRSKFCKEDEKFKRSWQDYHRYYATYQWLCRSCNSSKGAK